MSFLINAEWNKWNVNIMEYKMELKGITVYIYYWYNTYENTYLYAGVFLRIEWGNINGSSSGIPSISLGKGICDVTVKYKMHKYSMLYKKIIYKVINYLW